MAFFRWWECVPNKTELRKAITALKRSIRYWNNIMNGKTSMSGITGCALCKEYRNPSCSGCPILFDTDCYYCCNTPMKEFENTKDRLWRYNGWIVNGPDSLDAAMTELLYLMFLLPDGEECPI